MTYLLFILILILVYLDQKSVVADIADSGFVLKNYDQWKEKRI